MFYYFVGGAIAAPVIGKDDLPGVAKFSFYCLPQSLSQASEHGALIVEGNDN